MTDTKGFLNLVNVHMAVINLLPRGRIWYSEYRRRAESEKEKVVSAYLIIDAS